MAQTTRGHADLAQAPRPVTPARRLLVAPLRDPPPPSAIGRAARICRDPLGVDPALVLPVSLTVPGPSGSSEPSRLCRGCSRRLRRPPDRLPPASIRRYDGE